MNTGLIAIFILLIIIVGAIATRRCVEFLIGGSLLAAIFMYGKDFLPQWCTLIQDVLAENVWIVLVCGLFGSLIALLQESKGTFGFQKLVSKFCNTERRTLLTTFVMGILIFVDDYLNVLSIGVCRKVSATNVKSRERRWLICWMPPVLRCVYCFRFLHGLFFTQVFLLTRQV